MAELVSGDVNSSNNSSEPPKKFNFLPLIALCAIVVVLVGWGIIAIRTNRGPDTGESEVAREAEMLMPEQHDENFNSEAEPVAITGETLDVTQNGIHLTVQPKDLILTPSKQFGISITLEILDDINPEIKELRLQTISQSLAENNFVWGENLLNFKEDWEASSDAITVKNFSGYRIQNFMPGDTITFTFFSTCTKDSNVTESTTSTTVTNAILGYQNPKEESYNAASLLMNFDYNITMTEEYTGEVRHSLNYALNEARMETLDTEKRFELFTENLDKEALGIEVENIGNRVVKLHMPNGDIFEVNLNPDHDGKQIFDH